MEVSQVMACPVCTLYLREGMSMHSHLDTHPKDQVIEALVRMYTTADRSAGPFPHASHLASFVPVMTEEHIVIGRQQVTSVIHQPIMQYPTVYHASTPASAAQQHQFLQAATQQSPTQQHHSHLHAAHNHHHVPHHYHLDQQGENDKSIVPNAGVNLDASQPHDFSSCQSVINLSQCSSDNGGGNNSTSNGYESQHQQETVNLSMAENKNVSPVDENNSNHGNLHHQHHSASSAAAVLADEDHDAYYHHLAGTASSMVPVSSSSPIRSHESPVLSVRSGLTPDRVVLPMTHQISADYHHYSHQQQQIVPPECEDDAARHAEDASPKLIIQDLKKVENKDSECNQNLPNLQSYERLPPHGELSTHSVNSEWADDPDGCEAIEEPETVVVVGTGMNSGTSELWDLPRSGDSKCLTPETYPCMYCDQNLKSLKERRLHLASAHAHTGPETKQVHVSSNSMVSTVGAGVAGVKLSPRPQPRRRMMRICNICSETFSTLKEFRTHNRLVHPKTFRKCSVCDQEFSSKEKQIEHLVNVHPLECQQCGKTFNTPAGLSLHSKTHLLVKPYQCHLCPKSFVTQQKLKEHINGHTGVAPLQCDLCPSKFRRYSNLKQHKDIAHFKKKKLKDYFCECGESFPSKKKLARHQEMHTSKPKQCPYCSEKYVYTTSLTRHIRRNHDAEYLPKTASSKTKNVQCHICNLTCVESSLNNHLRQHSFGKIFSCVICGKKFNKKWNLSVHKWTHASRVSKPYKCNLCKGAFIRFGDFQAHIRSHLGHKPFTCNYCGLQFIRKQNWIRHEREHTSVKAYSCNECGKTFSRSYYLTEHLRVHSGVKPYTCHICNKMSATKSNHNKHLRTHHARETINTEG